jgi:hypothetical protein
LRLSTQSSLLTTYKRNDQNRQSFLAAPFDARHTVQLKRWGRAMRKGAIFFLSVVFALAGCTGPRLPVNPPRLVMSTETDMAIQLFMQATILLSNYYGYPTIRYSEIQTRSARAGFSTLPFMPPETVRATPELVNFFNTYENNRSALDALITKYGYKALVKYYIRTGLRAAQSICRNYLLSLEERNQYLEFLQREIGVVATLSTAILTLVNANDTLTKSFMIGRTAIDGAIDVYQEFRFLNIDREAARVLVEAAQNKLAEHYLQQVDSASLDSNSAVGGYTFSDALSAVSMIEYQCTRTGIRHLLNRSISNSPTNMGVDQLTGQVFFRSAKQTVEGGDGTRSLRQVKPNAAAPLPAPPRVIIDPAPPPVVTAQPVPGQVSVVTPPRSSTTPTSRPCGQDPLDEAAMRLLQYVCPAGAIAAKPRGQLQELLTPMNPQKRVMIVLTVQSGENASLRAKLLSAARAKGLITP